MTFSRRRPRLFVYPKIENLIYCKACAVWFRRPDWSDALAVTECPSHPETKHALPKTKGLFRYQSRRDPSGLTRAAGIVKNDPRGILINNRAACIVAGVAENIVSRTGHSMLE